eukprot:TRINITY_DN3309_c0_g1_i12.p4 TRINITY_DN3309_c0_g1~~TRINITY_DN3309_c0_g1_i12.p4  ORF type:complete len:116 (-),score=3.84 TRINITY_DN3309_c0_g1_i12:760-1107(-)
MLSIYSVCVGVPATGQRYFKQQKSARCRVVGRVAYSQDQITRSADTVEHLADKWQDSVDHPEEILNEGKHQSLFLYNKTISRRQDEGRQPTSKKSVDLWAMCIHGKGAKIVTKNK